MSTEIAPKPGAQGLIERTRARLSISADGASVAAGGALSGFGIAIAPTGGLGAIGGLALLGIGGGLLFRGLHRLSESERLAAAIDGDTAASHLSRMRTLSDRIAGALRRSASLHPITGLPTREPLAQAIDEDVASQRGALFLGAVRFVDFDRLAAFDPQQANRALKLFADRVTAAAGGPHMVAQIDRDCLCIWFRGAADTDTANAELRAVGYVAAQDLEVGEQRLAPTIEVAASVAGAGDDAATLFPRVIAALRRPGQEPNGDALAVGATSAETVRDRFRLEQHLTQAIAEDQLTMVFQPVVDLAVGRVLGAEALLRWDHPELGKVSPAVFVPVIEAMGLSDRYGLWVLNAACREARRWRDEGLAELKVAVNLSAKQLADPNLRIKIERTLQRHGLQPRALELELTETAAMEDADRTRDVFRQLRALGVSLAIDDFGAGYSSLSYLKNLPFDKLKVDREFVTRVHERRDSAAICRALIELGRGLELSVLAEGVETAEEIAALRALGCSVFQGYHVSKPLEGEAFRAFARAGVRPVQASGPSPLFLRRKDSLLA